MKPVFFAVFVGALLARPAQAAEDTAVLEDLVYCLVCHGYEAQGNPSVGGPALIGIEDWYLQAALAAYRSGSRGGYAAAMDMQAAARQLPESELPRVRTLLSLLPASVDRGAAVADAATLQRGKLAWEQHCASCHGADGEGNEAMAAPALRRLNDWYLQAAWQAYVDGGRGTDGGPAAAQMAQLARALPASVDIAAVVAFLQQAR